MSNEQIVEDLVARLRALGLGSGVPDDSVDRPQLSPTVRVSLDKADMSVQEDDSRLTDARPPTTHTHTEAQVTGLTAKLATKLDQAQVQAIADAAAAAIVNGSPAALDTLQELAAALGNDPNFATTITTLIGTKAPAVHTHAATDISDATTVGRNVIKAADAAAARTAIGAGTGNGTSNLALGTTSTTALRGDANQFVTVLPTTGQIAGVIYHVTE